VLVILTVPAGLTATRAGAVHPMRFTAHTPGPFPNTPARQRQTISGQHLYVSPDAPAAAALRRLPKSAPAATRALLATIAAQPQANWLGDWLGPGPVESRTAALVGAANRAHAVLPLVLYNIPVRDCQGYSRGGAGSYAAYRQWIDAVAAGLSGARALVVLEPDALAHLDCLSVERRAGRLALLTYAVTQLTARPGVTVYLDAGHSAFRPADVMADRLVQAGVARAAGFALNVANFQTTDDEIAYGMAISARLGTKAGASLTHFVIDTGRNGLGPETGDEAAQESEAWCNPPGRALGARPVLTGLPSATDHPRSAGSGADAGADADADAGADSGTGTTTSLLDALLWIKPVGVSDGTCRGGPAAGTWWLPYALGLASRAAR
jgi:endoglucanase